MKYLFNNVWIRSLNQNSVGKLCEVWYVHVFWPKIFLMWYFLWCNFQSCVFNVLGNRLVRLLWRGPSSVCYVAIAA